MFDSSTEFMVSQAPVDVLPSPADRPTADVVVYDGNCGFCRYQMNRLSRWDTGGRLSYVSLHAAEVYTRWPDLDPDQLLQEICVITRDGRRLFGAAAFKYLSTRLPKLWPLAVLMHIPFSMPLWRALYRGFARRRYRLSEKYPCTDNACHLPRKSSASPRGPSL